MAYLGGFSGRWLKLLLWMFEHLSAIRPGTLDRSRSTSIFVWYVWTLEDKILRLVRTVR
jgi:hypothetical protein